jgi:AcrR family transcriptional regulator
MGGRCTLRAGVIALSADLPILQIVTSLAQDSLAHDECASFREQKKAATREALRRAAVTLIVQRGLTEVTVEDIAAAAGVSTRTFFNYFPTKEDAVSGWDPALAAEMVSQLRARPAEESAPAALRAMLVSVLSPFDTDHRDLLERLAVVRSDPHLLAHHISRWSETERQLVMTLSERRGSDAPRDRYAALVVATTLAAARAAMMAWCDAKGEISLSDELIFHLEVLLAGLAEPERSNA